MKFEKRSGLLCITSYSRFPTVKCSLSGLCLALKLFSTTVCCVEIKGPSINDVSYFSQFLTPSPQYRQFFVLSFGDFDQFLTPPLLPTADVVYGRPQILTLKLLWKNDHNAKQRTERVHFKIGDLKSDNQCLYPVCNFKMTGVLVVNSLGITQR